MDDFRLDVTTINQNDQFIIFYHMKILYIYNGVFF